MFNNMALHRFISFDGKPRDVIFFDLVPEELIGCEKILTKNYSQLNQQAAENFKNKKMNPADQLK